MAIASPADARRVALVIGNAAYKIGALQTPVSDASAVAEALERQLGFDKVILKKNLNRIGFRTAFQELLREISGARTGVIYYAGHGLEVGGRNFLIPVDATLERSADLELETIPLESALAQLEGVSDLKLVVLDACRPNPFALAGSKRPVGRGLARFVPEDKGTLLIYAAKDGTTADDGVGRPQSLFTQALLKHIATPKLDVRTLMAKVSDEVASASSGQQLPQLYGTLGDKGYYLRLKREEAKREEVKTPELNTPKFETPKFETPKFETPELRAKALKAQVPPQSPSGPLPKADAPPSQMPVGEAPRTSQAMPYPAPPGPKIVAPPSAPKKAPAYVTPKTPPPVVRKKAPSIAAPAPAPAPKARPCFLPTHPAGSAVPC